MTENASPAAIRRQGSEKLCGAGTQAIIAICQQRGWWVVYPFEIPDLTRSEY